MVIGSRTKAEIEAAAAEIADATGRTVLPVVLDVADRAVIFCKRVQGERPIEDHFSLSRV